MSVTSAAPRESGRSLIPHDTSYQSNSPPALRPDTIGNQYTSGAFPPRGSSPRFPTTATAARARARTRAVHSGYPRSGSPGSHELSSDDEYDSHVGPVRSIKSHSRRQPPGHIPRPRNAFILYRSWYVKQDFLAGVENDHREISRIVGKVWQGLSESEREYWRVAAEREKRDHALRHPNYKYSPNSRRDGVPAPVRTIASRSTTRARKSESPARSRADDIAEAYLAGSRRCGLLDRIRQPDERPKARELEIVAKRAALPLSIQVPPRKGTLPAEVDSSSPESAELSSGSRDSESVATPSPLLKPEDSSRWGLEASSAPPSLALDSDASYPYATYESFDSQIAQSWPFREGFTGCETLNAIMSYGDVTTEQNSNERNNDSTLYHQYTITCESEHAATQPFHCIAQQYPFTSDLQPGPSDVPYGHLSTNHTVIGSYFEQLQQVGSAEPSMSSASGEDLGLLTEWCVPNSPVFVDDTHTSISSSSSTIRAPAPVYPKRFGFSSTWAGDLDDLGAYNYAIGEVRAELDAFDANGFAETEDGRI